MAKNCVVIMPGFAVPVRQVVVARLRIERAARVLVEADRKPKVELARGLMADQAPNSADPPVAQPFETLMNGRPVVPSSVTIVSALPAASDPP
jgi:hypothetical protein